MAKNLFRFLLLLLIFSDSFVSIYSIGVGINYGQIANNLPDATRVAYLFQSLNITRAKLYDADPVVLRAFANSNVEFVIGLGNEHLQTVTDPAQAQAWIRQYVLPYVSRTKIKCITIGNEVLGTNSTQFEPYLLPAMQTMYQALQTLGLSGNISITTAHKLTVLATSFPPSAGAFQQNVAQDIQRILQFHSQTGSPFLINAYPFFAYMNSPQEIPLSYVLFQPNPGTLDPATNLRYDNMLYAQIDSVYSAIRALGFTNIQVQVSETGWPSRGDPNEVGATPENARMYNGNLLNRIRQNEGTPANPSVPVDVHVFALFNENLKPGPSSERNYGLYYRDGTPVYNIGLQGYLPRISYSASAKNVIHFFHLLVSVAVLFYSL